MALALTITSLTTGATTTERIVVDPMTGLALSGYDPVAYFAAKAPRRGSGAHELPFAGAVWRFHNAGNRAAFAKHPEIYMPRFGGYDPIALGRGVALAGHPLVFLVKHDRLYLFAREQNRSAFEAQVAPALAAAERGWRAVEPTLAR